MVASAPLTGTTGPAARSPPDVRPLSDVKSTPITRNYHQCLYTQGVTVCRKATGDRFWVDCALTDAHRTLSDTGAAPAIVTTGLLAQMPSDALIVRDHSPVNFAVEGPDGGPLVPRGRATITFAIDDRAYEHSFLVVEGKPLMILGQDFLAPWRAKLDLNTDHDGRGVMKLGDHSVRVTSNAADLGSVARPVTTNRPKVSAASAVPPDAVGATAAAPSTTGTGEAEPIHSVAPELRDLAPAELAKKRLTLAEGSYVLYTSESVVLPPMSKRLVYLRAPEDVVKRGDSGVVTPVLQEAALRSNHPHVEVAAVTPDEHGMVPVTLWNTSRRQMVLPAFTLAAGLSTEYTIHDQQHAPYTHPLAVHRANTTTSVQS